MQPFMGLFKKRKNLSPEERATYLFTIIYRQKKQTLMGLCGAGLQKPSLLLSYHLK